jgi:hypothetical protein
MGTENPGIYKGIRNATLRFYLRAENNDFNIVNEAGKVRSNILRFVELYGDNLAGFHENYRQLAGMNIFALYLKGMEADRKKLIKYAVMEDGDFRGISTHNSKMISGRKIYFVTEKINKDKAALYEGLADSSFRPESD